ncbi:MAG: potassium channel family protein [Hyphomicrobiales bacterium]|nr:potassium channel family protein [Hyphomicrobiales bacterium]
MTGPMLLGGTIIAATVVIQTFGLILLTDFVSRLVPSVTRRFGEAGKMITITLTVLGLFSIHLLQVNVWAFVFWGQRDITDFETALYFSLVTFSTLGYGDILVAPQWRILAGLEGMNGFLLIGWSTAYLVSVSSRFGPFRPGTIF